MKIKYTKHSLKKFEDLKIFGFKITKSQVSSAPENPKYKSRDNGNLIAAVDFDEKHNLRVVYKKKGDIITVITFYPAAKGRYY